MHKDSCHNPTQVLPPQSAGVVTAFIQSSRCTLRISCARGLCTLTVTRHITEVLPLLSWLPFLSVYQKKLAFLLGLMFTFSVIEWLCIMVKFNFYVNTSFTYQCCYYLVAMENKPLKSQAFVFVYFHFKPKHQKPLDHQTCVCAWACFNLQLCSVLE